MELQQDQETYSDKLLNPNHINLPSSTNNNMIQQQQQYQSQYFEIKRDSRQSRNQLRRLRDQLNTNNQQNYLLSEYFIPRMNQTIERGQARVFKYSWFILMFYLIFYLLLTFTSLIVRAVQSTQLNGNGASQHSDNSQKSCLLNGEDKKNADCPFNSSAWFSFQQILFALAPFPIYYSVKLVIRDREKPYLLFIMFSNYPIYIFNFICGLIDHNPTIQDRRVGIYLALKRKAANLCLVLFTNQINLNNLVQSIMILVGYYSNKSDILSECYDYYPPLTKAMLIYAFFGILCAFRFVLMIYFFVWAIRNAQQQEQQQQQLQNISQSNQSSDQQQDIKTVKFEMIYYSEYLMKVLDSNLQKNQHSNNLNTPMCLNNYHNNQFYSSCEIQSDNNESQKNQVLTNPYLYSQSINQQNLQNIQQNYQQSETCPICCDNFKALDLVTYLDCNIKHVYHSACIQMWLGKNDTCPLCKQNVNPAINHITDSDQNSSDDEISEEDIESQRNDILS